MDCVKKKFHPIPFIRVRSGEREREREKIKIDRREGKTKITTVVFLSTMKKAINTRWSRHGRRGNEANIDFYRSCCEIFQN